MTTTIIMLVCWMLIGIMQAGTYLLTKNNCSWPSYWIAWLMVMVLIFTRISS